MCVISLLQVALVLLKLVDGLSLVVGALYAILSQIWLQPLPSVIKGGVALRAWFGICCFWLLE